MWPLLQIAEIPVGTTLLNYLLTCLTDEVGWKLLKNFNETIVWSRLIVKEESWEKGTIMDFYLSKFRAFRMLQPPFFATLSVLQDENL